MEDRQLQRRAENSFDDNERVIRDLIEKIEELEGKIVELGNVIEELNNN